MPGYVLEDKATRIFLNTRGKNEDEVSKELVDFLHYLENTTDETAASTGSERIRRIHDRVCKVRTSEEVGVKYMQAWEERYYDREEAREEGFAEGRMEGRTEGRMEGHMEGRMQGEELKLIRLVCKKIRKSLSVAEISDILEEDEKTIQEIYDVAICHAPDYDAEKIWEEMQKNMAADGK